MFTTLLFSLLTISVVHAHPTSAARDTTACHPDPVNAQFGIFGGITDRIHYWGLDAQNQLVDPDHAVVPSFNATFEVCPALGSGSNSDPQLESPSFGRIVLTPSIGGDHTCLTIINPSDAGSGNPLFAKAAECVNDTTPPAEQSWVYGYLADYGAMYWVGDADTPGHEDGYGFVELFDSPNTLQTDDQGRLKIALRDNVYPPSDGLWVVDFEFY